MTDIVVLEDTDGIEVVAAGEDIELHTQNDSSITVVLSGGSDGPPGPTGPAGPAGSDATGDVVGPAGATDGNPATFDGATGKLIKETTYAAFKTALVLVKGDVGLGNVDNTSDANKPVSTAQQTALDLKANLASPTFTGTVAGVSKSMVGLGNVDNTSDANKPVSTAQQTALNLKADLASPALTGNPTAPTQAALNNSTRLATTAYVDAATVAIIAASDAMVFKGVVDCSANPNYPAADRGHTYRVSVAGKIGGASGSNVEVGDILLSLDDGTASGNQATVGSHWSIAQTNIDGAVIGPASVTDGVLALFDGATGKLIKAGASPPTGTNTGDQTITLTGDVAGSGTGSFATTIGANKVANSQLAQIATATFKGRTTAGTGNVEDLTVTQATALLNALVGDSGSGGTKGLVPAPGSGDAAAGKFLKADGTFAVPAGGSSTGIAAAFKNLVVKPTASSLCTVTADELLLEDGSNVSYRAIGVNLAAIDVSTSGVNGLDTGAEASSTWYSVWVIYNGTTVAGLLSLSATAPTMPGGYTYKARVGWIRNDGSSNYLRTLQNGRSAHYVLGTNPLVAPNIANGTTGTYSLTSPTLATASVTTVAPSTATRINVAATNTWKAGSQVGVIVAPNTSWGGANNGPTGTAGQVWPIFLNNPSATGSGGFNWGQSAWIDLEATTIAWASGGAGGAINCLGWEDNI